MTDSDPNRLVVGSDEYRVLLRMPGRSGPANGRESTADENVPVPGSPLVESTGFMRWVRSGLVTMCRDERGKPFTEAQMPNQWSQDVASMDPEKVDEEDQH